MIRWEDFKAAIGEPDAGFDAALDAALRGASAKEARPVMKKKLTMVLIAAIVVAVALTGAALAVGLNLFEFFGRGDERLTRIAPQTTLKANTPAEVSSDELGETRAEFDSAYYDGRSLIAAYTIENYLRFERFEPDDTWIKAQLRQHRQLSAVPEGAESAVLDEYASAVERGEPCGYVVYTLEPSDHWLTDDGIDLPPECETQDVTSEGTLRCLREFETPLPEAALDRESLTIRVPLELYASCVYFDGAYYYEATESRDAGEMIATACRADGITRRYAGEGSYNGVPIHVEATASAVAATLTITADGMAFPDPRTVYPDSEDLWYWPVVEDENGATLDCTEDHISAERISASFNGNGALPERLKLYIAVEGEGEADDGIVSRAEPILLTPTGE